MSSMSAGVLGSEVAGSWKHGIIIPILKPGEDKTEVASYRPITLLSCVGKLLEKIICKRLNYWITSNSSLANHQCGFRAGMSTYDVLLRLEANIRKSLMSQTQTIVVYLDLKAAFDRVWHLGLLYKLAEMGLQGRMFRWIGNYLENRTSQVRLGNISSSSYFVGAGVPQGAVLSPTLFNIIMHDMPQDPKIDIYSYADDLTFSITGKSVNDIQKCM